jgi:hypothetical protein
MKSCRELHALVGGVYIYESFNEERREGYNIKSFSKSSIHKIVIEGFHIF